MDEREDLRHDSEAVLAAREELGKQLEPQLVDSFVDRIEQEIERRAKELESSRRPRGPAPMLPLALGSLGIAIPLLGIAGGTAGFPGIFVVCVALVLINAFWAWSAARRSR
jgi:hypothetical protein